MERFHYNMRHRRKDHLILEIIYSKCDSDCYMSYESKIDKCHIGSVSLKLVLYILHEKNRIRIWRNTHFLSMLIVIWLYENISCKLLLCYENLSISMWTKCTESVKEFSSK